METIQVGSLNFEYPLLMLAAGMCKTLEPEPIQKIQPAVSAVVAGSITPESRPGNTGKCQNFDNSLFALNAWGMPNQGAGSAQYSEGITGSFADSDTPVIVSVAGFSVNDYCYIARKLRLWADGLEINLGCPNIRDDGSQHKIASFDPEYILQILSAINEHEVVSSSITTIGLKLSVYSDPGMLKEVAAVIADFSELVSYVAVCNTFANGIGFDEKGRPMLETVEAGPFGGISGVALKPISLSNAYQFRQALPQDIAVIRVGGINTGRDVWESYQIGCAGVQIATAYSKEGPRVFNRIREELYTIHEEMS